MLANLTVPADGAYAFRLTSDDGSKLYLDDALAIDNDGLHGVESKDATVTLTAGAHPLRIEYFEDRFGQQLTLAWKPPGAADFAVVPSTVLSTEAGVVRVTAPGRSSARARPTPPATACRWTRSTRTTR